MRDGHGLLVASAVDVLHDGHLAAQVVVHVRDDELVGDRRSEELVAPGRSQASELSASAGNRMLCGPCFSL